MVYGSVNWVSANGSASTNIYFNTTKCDCIYLFYMSISLHIHCLYSFLLVTQQFILLWKDLKYTYMCAQL